MLVVSTKMEEFGLFFMNVLCVLCAFLIVKKVHVKVVSEHIMLTRLCKMWAIVQMMKMFIYQL